MMKTKCFIWSILFASTIGFNRSIFAQTLVTSDKSQPCSGSLWGWETAYDADIKLSTFVRFCNNTNRAVEIETFDENDGVRWIAHDKKTLPAKAKSGITARGNNIQIIIDRNRSKIYRCQKGQYCVWNGQTLAVN